MRSQLEEHVRNLCSNRYVSCATCRQDIPREEYEVGILDLKNISFGFYDLWLIGTSRKRKLLQV